VFSSHSVAVISLEFFGVQQFLDRKCNMHMVLSMSIAIKSESLTAARGNIVDDECVAIQKTDIAETVLGDQAEVGI